MTKQAKLIPWWELHVWTTGTDWVVAKSEKDAIAVFEETYGEIWTDYEDSEQWEILDPDTPLSIFCPNANLCDFIVPGSAEREVLEGEGRVNFTAPCRDWIRLYGRGLLCSTEY